MHVVLKIGMLIVLVLIVGFEEIYFVFGNVKMFVWLLNLLYFLLIFMFSWFGLLGFVLLLSKWYIEFGAFIVTDSFAVELVDDFVVLFELIDWVCEII